jgi:plasmid stability protein
MAQILIRKIDPHTKELLRQRAERRGKSLEADLRETLETMAREEAENPDDAEPFGDWAVRITRPGCDELSDILEEIRSAPIRPVKFE